MKELEKFLKVLSDGMRTLAQGVEGLAVKVDELASTQSPPTKPPPRKSTEESSKMAPKKTSTSTAQGTATDAVLAVIKRSKKGVNVVTLKQKTGFDEKKIHNIIYKLKKKGLIKSVSKGVYTKA